MTARARRSTALRVEQRKRPDPTAPVSVLLADDHTVFRQGLKRLLEDDRIKVVGEAADGREAIELVKAISPEVVLMDVAMPGLSGIEAARRIRRTSPGTNVLMLSEYADEHSIARALECGVVGYVLKNSPVSELLEAIRCAAEGRRYFAPAVCETIVSEYLRLRRERPQVESPFQALTAREQEILRLLTEGKTSKDIGGELGLSPKTVETHRANIMRKLDIHNIADLVRYAVSRGIVEL